MSFWLSSVGRRRPADRDRAPHRPVDRRRSQLCCQPQLSGPRRAGGRGAYRLGPSAFALSLASFEKLSNYDLLRQAALNLHQRTSLAVAATVWRKAGPVSVLNLHGRVNAGVRVSLRSSVAAALGGIARFPPIFPRINRCRCCGKNWGAWARPLPALTLSSRRNARMCCRTVTASRTTLTMPG